MAWIKLDPITRRRFARFRQIKRGYYSFVILTVAIVLSIFAPLLAESRALFVSYQGHWFFPTFQYLNMATFNQAPPPGWSTADIETEYLRLQREWQAERYFYDREAAQAGKNNQKLVQFDLKYSKPRNYGIMPPVPRDPYSHAFWLN